MKKILVPVDFNRLATSALQYASQLAHRSGAGLIVVYADTFDPPAEFTSVQTDALAESIEESRHKTIEELEKYSHEHIAESLIVRTEVREKLPVPGIIAAIAEHQPDLVVMGTHGRGGLSRLMFGSVTEAVLAATTVPVLTVNRVDAARPPQDIVCLVSGNERTDAAQRAAAEIASLFDARWRITRTTPHAPAPTADLIVIGEDSRTITRHARSPVLHVRDSWPAS